MSGRVIKRAAGACLVAAAVALSACAKNEQERFQGWVEADFIFVSADEQGRVEKLLVREGDRAAPGEQLAALDQALQQAEVGVAEATFANARQAFERAQQLLKSSAGTQKDFDTAQAALREAEARLAWAKTRLARRNLLSPVGGVVHQIYYRAGETVPAGRPVLALLPPGNYKVRFFVPEPQLQKIAIGDAVTVSCDGCPAPLEARVSFISRAAEFTPPVIYSLEERSKLVFLVEARPERPEALRVGQPVSVALGAAVAPREAKQ
jgi:HlyD family secretion protein